MLVGSKLDTLSEKYKVIMNLNEFRGLYFFIHLNSGCLDYVRTRAGRFCSDEEGRLDLTEAHNCKLASILKQWGPFDEVAMDDPLSKEIPANCSLHIARGMTFWNPNLAGQRNLRSQAICAVIGKHIPV